MSLPTISEGLVTVPDCTVPYQMGPIIWGWSSVMAIVAIIALAVLVFNWLDGRP